MAEEIVFNQLTTGASDDLQKATNMARSMVMQLGMSEVLGPRTFGSGQTSVFLGREIGEQRDYSEDVAQQIDSEVKRIVQSNYDRARKILTQYRDKLDELAKILIEQETLDRASFEEIMNGTTAGIGDTAPVVGD